MALATNLSETTSIQSTTSKPSEMGGWREHSSEQRTLVLSLQICVATLSAVGATLMGMGEQSVFLPVCAISIAITSVIITDYYQWFRLNANMANLAALFAVMLSLWQLQFLDRDSWLLTIAHMLTYWQFVLLFQEKTERHYWLLMTSSVLQVTVAAAMNLAIWFGLMMILYLVVGIGALALLFFYRESQRYRLQQSQQLSSLNEEATLAQCRYLQEASKLQGTTYLDPNFGKVTPKLLFRLAWICCLSLMITSVIFILLPRGGRSSWQRATSESQVVSGFGDSVDIEQMGRILQNPKHVMQVRFKQVSNDETMHLREDPYFRGTVMTEYQDGRWRRTMFQPTSPMPLLHVPPIENEEELIRQEIEIEPMDSRILFGSYPWAAVDSTSQVRFDEKQFFLIRTRDVQFRRFRYQLYTWGIENGKQASEFPQYHLERSGGGYSLGAWKLDPIDYDHLTRMPRTKGGQPLIHLETLSNKLVTPLPIQQATADFPPQSELEQRLTEYEQLDSAEVRKRAFKLRDHLQSSGDYSYTVDIQREHRYMDPIEEFIHHRKTGHCEFFASALALMLRSQNIPSRVVCGYHGGEWNEMGEFYQVRQYHAHAWVEAYLPNGNWIRLDATPAEERALSVEYQQSQFQGLRQITDYLHSIWAGYILGMDSSVQDRLIYEPLKKLIGSINQFLESYGIRFAALGELWELLWNGDWQSIWEEWINARTALSLLLWTLVGFCGWRCFRNWRSWFAWWKPKSPTKKHAADVAFYYHLEQLLATHHYKRLASQTHQEFANSVSEQLATREAFQSTAHLPKKFALAFYAIRYGHRTLEAEEQEQFEAELQQLQQSFSELPTSRTKDSSQNSS